MELAALKESLRKLAPNAVPVWTPEDRENRLPTGNQTLDALLAGGLPEGAITELSGEASSGKTALALSMARARTENDQLVAFLDTSGQLYPPAAAALGIDLRRLLVISLARPGATRRTKLEPGVALARATDILIRARHFPLIIIDLPTARLLPAKRIARLRQNAHATGATLLTLCNQPGTTVGAAMRLRVWPHKGPRTSRRLEVRVEKSRAAGGRAVVELSSFRVDHRPPRPLAKPINRTAPGVAPAKPTRALEGAA
ncbi:MAG: hypothetical protein KJO07_13515 [Deltaproteobacteria bacterium]|nr:hypothetical protein [Deltaproteobacteria bacterium]